MRFLFDNIYIKHDTIEMPARAAHCSSIKLREDIVSGIGMHDNLITAEASVAEAQMKKSSRFVTPNKGRRGFSSVKNLKPISHNGELCDGRCRQED